MGKTNSVILRLSAPFRVKPSFLIIGAQKSGTSALHYYLSQHPELVPAKTKENDYFSCNAKYAKGRESYGLCFPLRGFKRRLAYEASPSYLHNVKAPQRIFDYDRKLKLIAVLRDPIERAFSAWKMYCGFFELDNDWYMKWMTLCGGPEWRPAQLIRRDKNIISDFTAYLEQELDAGVENKQLEAPILTHGLYSEQIARYLSIFEESQLLIIQSNMLREDTIDTLSQVESFLGISKFDWDNSDLKPIFEGQGKNLKIPENCRQMLVNYYRKDCEILRIKYNISFTTKKVISND